MSAERNAIEGDPVTSFEAGITMSKGEAIAVCLKFSHFDGSHSITHWPMRSFGEFMEALSLYTNRIGMESLMFKAQHNPAMVDDLPPRHPYHTLLTEKPELSEDEIGEVKASTGVSKASFAFRGPTLEIRPTYGNQWTASILLHEYTAFSLYGYLSEYLKSYDLLMGPAAGTA